MRGSGNVLSTITVHGLLTNGAFNVVMYQFEPSTTGTPSLSTEAPEVVDAYELRPADLYRRHPEHRAAFDLDATTRSSCTATAELLVYEA
jgi:hypothetical protein